MSTALHALLASGQPQKKRDYEAASQIYKQVQKSDLFQGFSKVYSPAQEGGLVYPPESKQISMTTQEAIRILSDAEAQILNYETSVSATNQQASADVVVDGVVLLSAVPVTGLLAMQKRLQEIRSFVGALSELDPSRSWTFDEDQGYRRSDPVASHRVEKKTTIHVYQQADVKDGVLIPAQHTPVKEDVLMGTWTTTYLSGSIPRTEKARLLQRVETLLSAVRVARSRASEVEVVRRKDGETLLNWIFQNPPLS